MPGTAIITATASNGEKATCTVNTKIPAPEINIEKKVLQLQDEEVYKYIFKYDIKGASKIRVRVKNSSSSNIKRDLDKYVSKTKSDVESYLALGTNYVKKELGGQITFEIVAYYGDYKSETREITVK